LTSDMFHVNPVPLEEILALQTEIQVKARAQFSNFLTEEKYPNIRKCATSLTAMFGSTYLIESAFSHMQIIKSKQCSTMTNGNLEACLILYQKSQEQGSLNVLVMVFYCSGGVSV